MAGIRRFGGGSGGAQPVSVRAARQQDMHIMVNAIGSLTASNMAVVRPQVSGVLQSIQYQEGQQVKAGQLMAQIDPRAFAASVVQAEGSLARDTAQLENARVDLARYKDLLAKDAAPRQQMDTQAALVRQLEGTVKVDQGVLDNARLQLSYTNVLAPISGRVGLKQADLGDVVQPSDANGLVSIAQTRPIALVFAIPATQVPMLQARLAAKQVLAVQAWDKGGNKQLATGRVSTIDNAIDASTDSIKVKALFPNADDALFPNQSVSVRLQLDTLKDALTVPQAAVLRGAQGFYVYVAEADNTVSTRVIQPGVVDGDWMAVEGAVQPGEKVVVDGVDRLRNGAKVEVIAPTFKGGNTRGMGGKADGKSRGASEPGSADKAATEAGKPRANRSAAQDQSGAAGAAASDVTQKPSADYAQQAPATGAANGTDADGERRRAFFQSLSQEERDKVRAMSPEERQAWREKMRQHRGGQSGGGATN
jgi:multidrug efflux system membrane fusion protein